jgi:hypothetical protein
MTYVHVDGRSKLITVQRLLKLEPHPVSGLQILISVDDTNSAGDIAMPSRILLSRSDGLRMIDT